MLPPPAAIFNGDYSQGLASSSEVDSSVRIVVPFTTNETNLATPRVAAVWWTAGVGCWLAPMFDQTVFAEGERRVV